MKYILLSAERIVLEIIPGEDPVFPGVPIGKRYSAGFLAGLMPIEDEVEVEQNWIYDAASGDFSAPAVVEGDDPALTDAEALAVLLGEDEQEEME